MLVLTSKIKHNNRDITVFYVGRGSGPNNDTIWSDKRADSLDLVDIDSAEALAEELIETTTIKRI